MSTFKIMCVNAGSSSLKFKLYEMNAAASKEVRLRDKAKHLSVLTSGIVERIGHEDAIFTIKKPGGFKNTDVLPVQNHDEAVQLLLKGLIKFGIIKDLSEINGVGNRVVQGGKYFADSALFNEDTYKKIEELIPLDPLHAEAHLTCFNAFKKALPNVGEVAVFDTAFHQTMPKKAYLYGLPYEYYEKYKVRRYGFHGTSHSFVSKRCAEFLNMDLNNSKIIVAHLGNGASISAVVNGACVDTSMGLTPLEGLVMGTRSGDIDPAIMEYIAKKENLDIDGVMNVLNKKSGVEGISGVSSDFRDLEAAYNEGNERAIDACEVFAYRVAKYIGAYVAAMNGVDAIAFTAGIGENTSFIRTKILAYLGYLGITMDEKANEVRGEDKVISTADSKVKVCVIPTNEELAICRETVALVK